MSVVVIGINHRTSPVELLERMTIPAEGMPRALHGLAARDDIREAVVLSTCNRTEVYALAERFHAAYDDIRAFFCETSGLPPAEVTPHLYSQHDEAAVTHLFEVACGLDSAVIGETEIIGQVRDAWEKAMSEGVARGTLNLLFRHALEVGKRARTETSISRSTASVSHASVEMAVDMLGSLAEARVLVVGAGEMGEGVATAISRAGAGSIVVANRTPDRGAALAARVGARVTGLEGLGAEIAGADVIVSCTGAGTTVLDRGAVEEARDGASAPLLVIDIALPRDVEAGVGAIPGVTLRDLDDLNEWASRGIAAREGEVDKVRAIIAEEIDRFAIEVAQRQAAPLVAQLRGAVEEVRASEVARFTARLSHLGAEEREIIETMTKAIVAKVLHAPSVRLREAAGSPQGERLSAAVQDLFGLH